MFDFSNLDENHELFVTNIKNQLPFSNWKLLKIFGLMVLFG